MTSSNRAAAIARRAVALAVAAGLVGVAVANWSAPPSTPVPNQPERNVAAWNMPLDTAVGVTPDAEAWAEDLRLRPCLAEQGWTATAPDRDPRILLAADSWHDDSVVVPPLDAERAERFGHGPVTDTSEVAWTAWARQYNADAGLSRALDTCLPEVRGTSWGTPFDGQEVQSRARDLRVVARRDALADRDVVAAAARWRACLTQTGPGVGVDLPDDPMSLLLPTDDQIPVAVTDAERQFAQADVDCQLSSGYRAALYDAQWREESLVSSEDAVLFSSPKADQLAETADAVRGLLLDANR
jgi:hypothetical protein